MRTEIETGVSDGDLDRGHQSPRPEPAAGGRDEVPWTPIDGSEQVILGDLSILTDGAPVRVAPPPAGAKVRAGGAVMNLS